MLDRGSAEFRDPKVFWYDGAAGSYWVMVAVEATEYKVVLYKSADLKDWEHLSDFGPANATGGVWECPDLFALPVDGDAGATSSGSWWSTSTPAASPAAPAASTSSGTSTA